MMTEDQKYNGLCRRDAVGMDKLVEEFIRDMKLASGLNRQRVIEAWKTVSGAGRYTVDVYVRNKVMYCTIGSSVVRNQLYFQLNALTQRLNEYLSKDPLFAQHSTGPIVKKLILK